MINTAIQALNDMVNSFTRAAGAAERVLSLYDLTPDIDPDGGAHADLAVTKWSIAFEDVHFHYQMRPEQKVLQGMSFVVEEGRVCALVGRSGGGKSTVVHLMLRFYDPRSGRITLGGKDLKELNIASVHKHVGVVSQETMLFNSYAFGGAPAPPNPSREPVLSHIPCVHAQLVVAGQLART